MLTISSPIPLNGELTIPSSKSYAQRAVALAVLSGKNALIQNVNPCRDLHAALQAAEALGCANQLENDSVRINAATSTPSLEIYCGESGLAIRTFAAIAALQSREWTITGEGSLLKRPLEMLTATFNQLGVKCITTNGCAPLKIQGPLQHGRADVDGSVSSQFLSGLLMTLPLLDGDSELHVHNLQSRGYIDMTLELMQQFGVKITHRHYETFTIQGKQEYKPINCLVEGDWSSAAFWLAAGAYSGNIRVNGLNSFSCQGDKEILMALQAAGARMSIEAESVEVRSGNLRGFKFDATHTPDLFPPLVALASRCAGYSFIRGVLRLQHKESNRAVVLQSEFAKLGIEISLDGDLMIIKGGTLKSGRIDSHNDHRIAMAAAIAVLNSDCTVEIENPTAVDKSYPAFFADLKKLGGIISN